MRFLLDANLSPLIAALLTEAGHDTKHVRDVDLRHASDEQIMDFAAECGFVVVSQDTDFTNLLHYRKASGPSLVLLRNLPEVTSVQVSALILGNLDQFEAALVKGAVVSIVDDRIRVRRLPFQ
ncbi:MAG: hypothetical protein GEU97_03160 [Actinophytocola sp.]|nr:hypothetical protein [Actinophytocola sp.]